MNTPVNRLTAALKNLTGAPDKGQAAALDDMASHNLAGFFGTLFEIDQRLEGNKPHSDGFKS